MSILFYLRFGNSKIDPALIDWKIINQTQPRTLIINLKVTFI
ncbi:hypothetical protein RintRC_3267 [Richelia intracellularis]|nr:hypothetical protein RintRC_3267 [Richelia intracellularis]